MCEPHCLTLADLLLGALPDGGLPPVVRAVGGQQREALLRGGQRERGLAVGEVRIAQAVLRVGRRRIRLGVQREERNGVLVLAGLQPLVTRQVHHALGKQVGVRIALAGRVKQLRGLGMPPGSSTIDQNSRVAFAFGVTCAFGSAGSLSSVSSSQLTI